MSTHTIESLKHKAKIIREFLKEKYDVEILHGHSLELISKLFGFKDWNTASAVSKPKKEEHSLPLQIKTVRDMKRVLEAFDDLAIIDACYDFKLKEFEMDPMLNGESEINQEFSLSMEDFSYRDMVSFKLKLEDESATI